MERRDAEHLDNIEDRQQAVDRALQMILASRRIKQFAASRMAEAVESDSLGAPEPDSNAMPEVARDFHADMFVGRALGDDESDNEPPGAWEPGLDDSDGVPAF